MDPNNEIEGVQFETDSYKAVKFYDETGTPKIVNVVMKYSGGLVKEERHAYWVLFGFVVLAIILSLFLFFKGSTSNIKSPTPDIINRPQPAEGLIPS